MSRPDPLAEPDWYPQTPRAAPAPPAPPADPLQRALDAHVGPGTPIWRNSPEHHHDDDLCSVEAGVRCTLKADWWVWIGCPNEHINRSGVCDVHLPMIETFRGWTCENCWTATRQRVTAKFIKKEPVA